MSLKSKWNYLKNVISFCSGIIWVYDEGNDTVVR